MSSQRILATFLWVAFFLFPLQIRAAEDPLPLLRLTLADCLNLATKNNAKLTARDYAVDAAAWRSEESQIRFWPVIDLKSRMAPVPKDAGNAMDSFFSGDMTYFHSGRIAVGLPLFSFGQMKTAEKLAKQGVKAAHREKIKEEGQIHYEIKQLYYGILLARELKGLMANVLNKINNKLKEEEKTQKHSPYAIAKLKIFKLDLEKRLEEGIEKEKLAKEGLKLQLGLPSDQPFELYGTSLGNFETSLEAMERYRSLAAVSRPESQLVEIGVEAKRLEYTLEKRKLFPRLGVGGFFDIGRTTGTIRNLGRTDDFSNPFNFTRAGVGVDLEGRIDFHGANARIKRLNSEYYRASIEGALAKRGIDLEVQEAYSEALRMRENIRRSDEKIRLGRQMIFLSKSNLDLGVGEEQEYTDALQLVLFGRAEYYKALFDYQQAVAKLQWKSGFQR